MTPGRKLMILAGLTTSGTEGTAEFASSAAGLQRLEAVKVNFVKASSAKGPE